MTDGTAGGGGHGGEGPRNGTKADGHAKRPGGGSTAAGSDRILAGSAALIVGVCAAVTVWDVWQSRRAEEAAAAQGPGIGTAVIEPPVPWMEGAPRTPEATARAYRFAGDEPDVLRAVACFCGCEARGHEHAEHCFVEERHAGGVVAEWNRHGAACGVCVDVAEHAADGRAAGRSTEEIGRSADERWSRAPGRTPTVRFGAGGGTETADEDGERAQ